MQSRSNAHDGSEMVPLTQCRRVYVQRDYTNGLIVKFHTKLPQELQGKVEESIFEKTVSHLNQMYEEAEKAGSRSVCETFAGCVTCYLSQLCIPSQYEKRLHHIAKYLKQQNDSIFIPRGIFITDPVERGFRVIEISILNEQSQPRHS